MNCRNFTHVNKIVWSLKIWQKIIPVAVLKLMVSYAATLSPCKLTLNYMLLFMISCTLYSGIPSCPLSWLMMLHGVVIKLEWGAELDNIMYMRNRHTVYKTTITLLETLLNTSPFKCWVGQAVTNWRCCSYYNLVLLISMHGHSWLCWTWLWCEHETCITTPCHMAALFM